jgi:hypothetical protein
VVGFIATLIKVKVTVVGVVLGGLLAAGWLRLRREHAMWGLVPADIERVLPGDDLVPDADIVETRSLDIAAPPSAVWPWLVQMGYGRAGWYSYDQLDMRGPSARTIVPELQGLAEGDLVPTHPGGGFVARIVDPPHALVLYLDAQLVREQLAHAARRGERATALPERLDVVGALGDVTMPDFRASWAFVLDANSDAGTHLIERFRARTGEAGLPRRLGMPFMGYGVFAMTRRQMLGIKARAEAAWRRSSPPPSVAVEGSPLEPPPEVGSAMT